MKNMSWKFAWSVSEFYASHNYNGLIGALCVSGSMHFLKQSFGSTSVSLAVFEYDWFYPVIHNVMTEMDT